MVWTRETVIEAALKCKTKREFFLKIGNYLYLCPMTKKYILLIIGLFLILTSGVIEYNDDYTTTKTRKCLVLDKMQIAGGYYPGQLYLVVRSEGQVFDIKVRPADYSQTHVGDTLYFKLSQFDIHQNERDNVIYLFANIITGIIGGIILIVLFFSKYF